MSEGLFLLERMIHLLSIARSTHDRYLVLCLHNRKLVPRMCALSFNRAIALYLLLLHAVVLINTCSEVDTLVGLSGTRLTLTVASMGIPPLAHQYFRLLSLSSVRSRAFLPGHASAASALRLRLCPSHLSR